MYLFLQDLISKSLVKFIDIANSNKMGTVALGQSTHRALKKITNYYWIIITYKY